MAISEFYWRNARDSLLTPAAVQLFQIIASHEGEDFETAKAQIDADYLIARGRDEDNRHGGKVQTAIAVYREAGWVELRPDDGKQLIQITPAGKQALVLLSKTPDFLKAAPTFILRILSRYQLNNPAKPSSRNEGYDEALETSDIFPYWTLFRIMRSCDNYITSAELRRFVFKLPSTDKIPDAVVAIKNYRADVQTGLTPQQLDQKYPVPLTGALGESKYIMARLGTRVGKDQPVLIKDTADSWRLNDAYLALIDEILAHPPTFKEYLSEEAWMANYGALVDVSTSSEDFDAPEDFIEIANDLPDQDPIWIEFNELIEAGSLSVILSGPPGTSKTWYAGKLATKLVKGENGRISHVQFHPSYGYDDFLEGYVPAPGSGANFKLQAKVFKRLAHRAATSTGPHVLVIDELSRGDVSRIFGEVLTYIEPSYRGRPFLLPYSGTKFSVPPNLIILATMNPYDKSVTELDDALDRRMDRISLDPSVTILKELLAQAHTPGEIVGKIVGFFTEANKLSPHGLGHAFFVGVKTDADLIRLWNTKLRFVFEKMFRFSEDNFQLVKESFKAIVSEAAKLK